MRLNLRIFLVLLFANITVLAVNISWKTTQKIPDRLGNEPSPYDAYAALVKEFINEDPEIDYTYAFAEFWPGSKIENLCVGGKHVRFVIVEFKRGNTVEGYYLDLRGDVGDWYKAHMSGSSVEFAKEKIIPSRVAAVIAHKNVHNYLGKSKTNRQVRQIMQDLEAKSVAYFNANPTYDIFKNNCNIYVNFLITAIHSSDGGINPCCD